MKEKIFFLLILISEDFLAMSKSRKMVQDEKKIVQVEFKDLQSNNFSIVENKRTKRKELILDKKNIYSSSNSEYCKNVAKDRFSIDLESWLVLK